MNPIESHSWDAFSSSLDKTGDDHSNSYYDDSYRSYDDSDSSSSLSDSSGLIICEGNDHSGSFKEKCILLNDEVFDINLIYSLSPPEVDEKQKKISITNIHILSEKQTFSKNDHSENFEKNDLTHLWVNPFLANEKDRKSNNEKDRKSNEKQVETYEDYIKYQRLTGNFDRSEGSRMSSDSIEKKKWKNKILRRFK